MEEVTPSEAGTPRKRRKRLLDRLPRMDEWRVIRRVLHYAKPYRGRIIFAIGIGMIAGMLTALNLLALIPVLKILLDSDEVKAGQVTYLEDRVGKLQTEYEEETAPHTRAKLWWYVKRTEAHLAWTEWVVRMEEKVIYIMAAILVAAQIVKSLLEFLSKYTLQKSFFLSIVRLKTALYDRCLRLDMSHLERTTSGDIIARLNNDVKAVRNVFTTMMGEAILAPFTVMFLLSALFLLNWRMTLIVLVGMPVIIIPIAYVGKRLRMMGRKDEEEDAKILGSVQETIQGLMIVKSFTTEERELRRFRDLSREMARRQIRREKIRLYSEPFVEITASIAMAGVLCIGAYIVLQSGTAGMSAEAFLAYIAILSRFYPPVKKVSNTFVKLQKALASADRIFEIIDTTPEVAERHDAVELPEFSDRIELQDVIFTYRPEKPPALDGFGLTIPKGRKIALVGESGAGKSTVAKLIPRLYDPEAGRILVDGHDVRDVTLYSLRRQIAVVSQDTILFNGSVLHNIAYAKVDASMEEVIEAAKAANAHDFIMALPQGYDTLIGERGGQLSGGQKQRLAIARALLANTPILILDEATSALDNESEAQVQQAIDALMENRTVVVIAHRLSTIRKADEIVVMEAGRIAERGTHAELIVQEGIYARLIRQAERTESTGVAMLP